MILLGFPEILAFPDSAKFRRFQIMGRDIGESGLRGVVLGGRGGWGLLKRWEVEE